MTLLGMQTETLYLVLVGIVALERALELVISNRNARQLFRRGAVETGTRNYRWMVLLHGSFLIACPAEVVIMDRPFIPPLAAGMTAVLVLTMALRYWVIATLGTRWTTRVIWVPGSSRIVAGPYRWMRHPNYLGVVLELAALPLIHTAWLTALVYGVGNAWVLRHRLAVEEAALSRTAAPAECAAEGTGDTK